MDYISYICDTKRKCKNSSLCGNECTHSTDICNSVYWDHIPNEKELWRYFSMKSYVSGDRYWVEKPRVLEEDV